MGDRNEVRPIQREISKKKNTQDIEERGRRKVNSLGREGKGNQKVLKEESSNPR